MVSLSTIFWIFIIFFGLIGALRGWAKEIVATAGLVLSLFTLQTFGPRLLDLMGLVNVQAVPIDPDAIYRRQFWVLAMIHLGIAFFSYQGPTLASGVGTRLQRRDNVQDKLLGWIIGTLNGYLIVGTLISFLEYRVVRNAATGVLEFVPLLAVDGYPFDPSRITRPVDVVNATFYNYLPLTMTTESALLLPLLMVALFLVILIVIV